MSNKLKVKDVPNDMALFICHQIHQSKDGLTKKQHIKGSKSLGYNKMAQKMQRLGYRPNYKTYDSPYSWMD
ncbi:hypothetical protein MYO4S_00122 [Serratia phage 4S]|nr:hypothetical protein MYO4S_00122 [Serratia phage 4S]